MYLLIIYLCEHCIPSWLWRGDQISSLTGSNIGSCIIMLPVACSRDQKTDTVI